MPGPPTSHLDRRRIQCEAVYWDWRLKDPELSVDEWIQFLEWHSIPAHREMLDVVAVVRAQQPHSPPGFSSEAPLGVRIRRDVERLLVRAPAVAMILAALFPNFPSPHRVFQTQDAPEARLLQDGSTVRAEPNTRVDIQLRRRYRALHLVQGEAFFSVAPDASRPFVVRTSEAMMQALGTRFVVSVHDEESVLTVLEGTVAVTLAPGQRDAGASPSPSVHHLGPSEQLRVSREGLHGRPQPADLAAFAWATTVSFEELSVTQAIEEFNQRSAIRIQLMQPHSAGSLRVSGAFQLDDPGGFAAFIARRTATPVQLHRTGASVQTIQPPPTGPGA